MVGEVWVCSGQSNMAMMLRDIPDAAKEINPGGGSKYPAVRLFDVPPTNEVWIRLNGMFVLCLSFYYVKAARSELTDFIRWTVWARAAVILYFVSFVLLVSAPKALLLFGLIDLLAAFWTWRALKKGA